MSDGRIFDLRAQALRLISHTRTFETSDALVSEGLGHFQSLQESIRKSVQKLEDARIATVKAAPPVAAIKAPLAPGTRFETNQTQYAAALADQDVIEALLQLHHETEIEHRIERTKAAQSPQPEKVDFEQMQFSRTRQTSRGIFSPILKPPKREPGRSD